MCLLGWMKRGIHAKADRRAAWRVITPSLSAPVCPGSCPNTQMLLLGPHFKAWTAAVISPALHRKRLCVTNHRNPQRFTNLSVISRSSLPRPKYLPQTQLGFFFNYYYFLEFKGQTIVTSSIVLRVLSKLTKGSAHRETVGAVLGNVAVPAVQTRWGKHKEKQLKGFCGTLNELQAYLCFIAGAQRQKKKGPIKDLQVQT